MNQKTHRTKMSEVNDVRQMNNLPSIYTYFREDLKQAIKRAVSRRKVSLERAQLVLSHLQHIESKTETKNKRAPLITFCNKLAYISELPSTVRSLGKVYIRLLSKRS